MPKWLVGKSAPRDPLAFKETIPQVVSLYSLPPNSYSVLNEMAISSGRTDTTIDLPVLLGLTHGERVL